MRNLIVILIIIFFPIKNFGQLKYDYKQGYKFIKKAENKLNKGNLNKAEEFLNKAELSNYGFCGNAWASANSQIKLIRVQVFNKRKDFDKALSLLDSIGGCGFGADCEARDSLKIVTLIYKFGKDKVKQSINKVNNINVTEIDFINSCSINLLDLQYTFRFELSQYYYVFENGKSIEKTKTNSEMLNELKNYNYFKLLD